MNFMSQSSQHIGHSGGPLLEAQKGSVRPTATGDKCNVSEPTLNWHHAAQKAEIGLLQEEREEKQRRQNEGRQLLTAFFP